MTQPLLTFNDGAALPQLGLGVWQVPDDEAAVIVQAAVDAGYRHVDTAAIYQNEQGQYVVAYRGTDDWGLEVNLDSVYTIMEGLDLYNQIGYIHNDIEDGNIAGITVDNETDDAWEFAVGFRYTF